MLYFFSFHTAQTPYLSELITHYLPPRALRSSNTNLLAKPSGITANFPVDNFLFPHHKLGTHCLHISVLLTNYPPSNVNWSLTYFSLLLPSYDLALYKFERMMCCLSGGQRSIEFCQRQHRARLSVGLQRRTSVWRTYVHFFVCLCVYCIQDFSHNIMSRSNCCHLNSHRAMILENGRIPDRS